MNADTKTENQDGQSDIKSEYYLGEQFETYSRHDGYSQTPSRPGTSKNTSIKDEVYDDHLGDSTICSSQASTIYSDDNNSVHDGMSYDLLLNDDQFETDSNATITDGEPLTQTGKYFRNFQNSEIIINLVPNHVLSIYPRKDSSDRFTDKEVKDFKDECIRTRNLVDRVPLPNRQRKLDPVTHRLGYEDQLAFYNIGNELLVSNL